jgi:nickel-dependent lactate racemase
MKLALEYGPGFMEADFADASVDVFIPGESYPDPPHIPLDQVAAETLRAIRNPIGMPSIAESVKPGDKVTIVFPDRVKGGAHPTAHRIVAIPLVLEELRQAGVRKQDIKLICSNGLHRKNTPEEIRSLIGAAVFDEFWGSKQIVNHDSEDYDNLIDLGLDDLGDRVIMNKEVYESDFAVMIGHVLANPYGGYSGGYKHPVTGISHWRCIGEHHNPEVMHRPDFTPTTTKSLMRAKFDHIGMRMEEAMGKKFFCVDAVLDTKARQIAVFSGYAREIQPLSWEIANRRTFARWADKKYDVMVFGMPQAFHYGNGMGTNPILMMQAISAQILRHKRVMRDNCVIIASSLCNGYWHKEEFPSYEATYNVFQGNYNNQLSDMARYGEYFATRKEYTDQYRFNWGYHPFHAFSMISCAHIAEMHTAAVYIVGAIEPGYARGMGLKTRATFEEALKDAQRKYVGDKPNILALPKAFTTAAMHICMKDDVI